MPAIRIPQNGGGAFGDLDIPMVESGPSLESLDISAIQTQLPDLLRIPEGFERLELIRGFARRYEIGIIVLQQNQFGWNQIYQIEPPAGFQNPTMVHANIALDGQISIEIVTFS